MWTIAVTMSTTPARPAFPIKHLHFLLLQAAIVYTFVAAARLLTGCKSRLARPSSAREAFAPQQKVLLKGRVRHQSEMGMVGFKDYSKFDVLLPRLQKKKKTCPKRNI